MRCKLAAKAAPGHYTAGGDGVLLERGKEYDLNPNQIAALGKVVEAVNPPRKRRKAKTRSK